MDIEDLINYCLQKPATSQDFPFDENTLVFKVGNKMFCLTNLTKDLNINLKCDPEKAIELREEHSEITGGYHMSKKHWNTIDLTGGLTNKLIKNLIDDSYNLVIRSMSKKERQALNLDN